jgi:ribosomal protein S4
MQKFMSSCINYDAKEQAREAFIGFLEKKLDVVISRDGLTVTRLQDKPVQTGQVPYTG